MLLKIDQAFKTSNGLLVTETVDGGRRVYIPMDVLEEMFERLGIAQEMKKMSDIAEEESLTQKPMNVEAEASPMLPSAGKRPNVTASSHPAQIPARRPNPPVIRPGRY